YLQIDALAGGTMPASLNRIRDGVGGRSSVRCDIELSVVLCEPSNDDFSEAITPETWKMPSMYRRDWQLHQPLHTRYVVAHVGVIGIFDEITVENDISREQKSCRRFKQRNPPGRMSRRMNNFEMPVTQIYQISIRQQSGSGCTWN